MRLEGYVGRVVRLKQESFLPIELRAQRRGMEMENCFIVASVHPEMHKLICYGADFRVAVRPTEVALL